MKFYMAPESTNKMQDSAKWEEGVIWTQANKIFVRLHLAKATWNTTGSAQLTDQKNKCKKYDSKLDTYTPQLHSSCTGFIDIKPPAPPPSGGTVFKARQVAKELQYVNQYVMPTDFKITKNSHLSMPRRISRSVNYINTTEKYTVNKTNTMKLS